MLEEFGRVVAIAGDDVEVETQRQSACSSCKARSGCGQKLLSERGAAKAFIVSVRNARHLQLAPGDEVVLGLEESRLLLASVWVYLVPLLGLIVAAAVADWMAASEPLVVAAAVVGLLLGLGWVRMRGPQGHSACEFQPILLRKVG